MSKQLLARLLLAGITLSLGTGLQGMEGMEKKVELLQTVQPETFYMPQFKQRSLPLALQNIPAEELTTLMISAAYGLRHTTEALLGMHFPLNQHVRLAPFWNPLMLAADGGHVETVKLLLERTAKIKIENLFVLDNLLTGLSKKEAIAIAIVEHLFTALEEDIAHPSALQRVWDPGSGLWKIQNHKALHALISLFMARGMDVHRKDTEGRTILLFIVKTVCNKMYYNERDLLKLCKEFIEWLVLHGADREHKDEHVNTVFSILARRDVCTDDQSIRFLTDYHRELHRFFMNYKPR